MARYQNALTTLQARTIVDIITKEAGEMRTRYQIEDTAIELVHKLERDYPAQFPVVDDLEKAYLAFAFCACARFAVKCGNLTVCEYIAMLATLKQDNESALYDFGAFGDLLEVLVRCAFLRNRYFVRWSALNVKAITQSDIESKKYGVIEVGHNGKTLSYGTMLDYMAGEYTSVVYGVFSKEDKKEVYRLCQTKQYDKALDYVTSYCVYWESKYQFLHDIDNLTRGKGIVAKSQGIQVVYNESKYNAFVKAIDDGKFTSLFEMLKRGK